jgi:hypothetical protein
MSDSHELDAHAVDANQRYWSTDVSVNQIADGLGLSKSSLYGLIRPLQTGLACPDCAAELAFLNRTARDRGLVACAVCGFEGGHEEITERVEEGRESVGAAGHGRPPMGSGTRSVAGAALLGLAAGILIGSLARR